MKRAVGTILFVIYSIMAILVTVLLLSFNEYNCSEIGEYTVYIVKDDSLEPEYKQGSILLIKSTSDKNVQIGDNLFIYKVINSQEYELVHRKLAKKIQQGNHIVYEVEMDENEANNKIEGKTGSYEDYASDYFIGKADDTIVINGWGVLLGILESKWGYLFCIVVVSLLLFLQEVFDLIVEIKYGGTKSKETPNTTDITDTTNIKNTTNTVKVADVANTTKKVTRKVKNPQTGVKEG